MLCFKKICFILLVIASLTRAVKIKCNHQRNAWTSRGSLQECLVEDLIVSSDEEVVTNLESHGYTTIRSFFIHKSPLCNYIPSGVTKFLDHLEVLIVAGTGLRSLKQTDLAPFEFVEELYLNHNQLEVLESDLFELNPKITIINFGNNKFKQIGYNVLEPLENLKNINFKNNECINMDAGSARQLTLLKSKLRSSCSMPDEEINATTSPPPVTAALVSPQVDCDESQKVHDLESKVVELEVQLNQTLSELSSVTSDFCHQFSDWENEKCKNVETTPRAETTVHPDDQTEDYIMSVVQ